jgi:hypothetical protein
LIQPTAVLFFFNDVMLPVVPIAGMVSSLYVLLDGPEPVTELSDFTWTFTVQKNGAGTVLSCTVVEGATACNDTSDSFTVVPGDTLQILAENAAGFSLTDPRASYAVAVTAD